MNNIKTYSKNSKDLQRNIYIRSYADYLEILKKSNWTDDNIDFVKVAIISIGNSDGSIVHPLSNAHLNVLNVDFDDVNKDYPDEGYYGISHTQANKIYNFIKSNVDKEDFLVHCGAGISRSSAVGLFIVDYFRFLGEKNITVHQIHPMQPNPRVSRYLDFELMTDEEESN